MTESSTEQLQQLNKKKTASRKFAVWLVWLALTIGVLIYAFIKNDSKLLSQLVEYFFYISMMYLGMNVGQKIGFAAADAFTAHSINKHTPSDVPDKEK